MGKKHPDEKTDLDRLHEWMANVEGNVSIGSATLDSVEISKSENKVTIVLKKPKADKKSGAAANDA
jgi:hypothetical protein